MSVEGGQLGDGHPRPRVVPRAAARPASMTWRQAQSAAMLAAAQAHGDLGVSRRDLFVEVVAALAASGVPHLMWRPMGALFGAYLKQPGAPAGVLVNNGIPLAARRMTVAHELGHHRFGHATSLDDERLAGGSGGRRAGRWTDQEKLAESFAMWFLMPPMAVQAAVELVTGGAPRLSAPEQAYQVSLLMGVPYRTLVRHLPAVRQVSPATAKAWASVQPGRLKARAGAGFVAPDTGRSDVFVVGPAYDRVGLVVKEGDRLVFQAPPVVEPGTGEVAQWPWWLAPVARDGAVLGVGTAVAFEVRAVLNEQDDIEAPLGSAALSVPEVGTVRVRVASRPWGLEQGRSLG